jgi:thiamine biosynthesis lipoprotein
VAIRNPEKKNDYFLRIPVKNGAVTTAGNYEESFNEKGKKISHILNPSTGRTAEMSLSATVIP